MNLESCAGWKRTYWKLEFLFSPPPFSRIWLSFVEWILRTFLSEEGGSALWFKEIKHKEELWYSTLTQQYAAGVIAKTFLSKVTFSFPALKNSCSKNVVQSPTLLSVTYKYTARSENSICTIGRKHFANERNFRMHRWQTNWTHNSPIYDECQTQ